MLTKETSPYLIHKTNGNVVANNEHFSKLNTMRPLTMEELRDRPELTMPDEVSLMVAGHIELPVDFDEYTKADMNSFVVEHRLASSINVSKPGPELLHEIKVMVAMHNKEVADATNFLPDLPTDFYSFTVSALKKHCEAEGIRGINFNQQKSEIQDDIVAHLTNEKFKEATAEAESRSVKIEAMRI